MSSKEVIDKLSKLSVTSSSKDETWWKEFGWTKWNGPEVKLSIEQKTALAASVAEEVRTRRPDNSLWGIRFFKWFHSCVIWWLISVIMIPWYKKSWEWTLMCSSISLRSVVVVTHSNQTTHSHYEEFDSSNDFTPCVIWWLIRVIILIQKILRMNFDVFLDFFT